MFYNNINVKTTDICQLLPLCIKKTANIKKNFIGEIHIDDVQSIYITTNKSIASKEEAERIINSTKAIKYFQDFKTFWYIFFKIMIIRHSNFITYKF